MTDQAAPEISPLDFARALERGEAMQVVDVRAPARVAQGRIDLVPDARFHNIRGSELITYASLDRTGIEERGQFYLQRVHWNTLGLYFEF